MNSSFSTILVSGAGRLGSRYLQGLAKCRLPLKIYVQHANAESLSRAEKHWNEILTPEMVHEVSFHTSFEHLPAQIDIAIVATTADIRPHVVGKITRHTVVRYWVLEKILAQSEKNLDDLLSHVSEGSKAWVNTARRIIPWHQQIKSKLGLSHPMTLKVDGGAWGLACNAIHFLDLLAWWTGETLLEVRTDSLSQNWFESKRPGNWEVSGTLEARFSGGSRASLSAVEDGDYTSLEVSDSRLLWLIDESKGMASRSDGIKIPGRITYQSEMSAGLVESILETGCCGLPTLEESAALHRVFIRSMLEHWKQMGNPAAAIVPIT